MTGLHSTGPSPPSAAGVRPRSARRLPSTLQATPNTSKPARSSSLRSVRLSSSSIVQVAMPILRAPMRAANSMVSCTRVRFAQRSLVSAAACMTRWFSGSR